MRPKWRNVKSRRTNGAIKVASYRHAIAKRIRFSSAVRIARRQLSTI